MLSRSLPKKVLNRISKSFIGPSVFLDQLDMSEGDRVLEMGLPIGFFASAAISKVGDKGEVYVSGPTHESLERLTHLATQHSNLRKTLLADILIGRAAPHHSIDWVILTNLLSNSLHPDEFCLAVGQYLKPDSRIVLIDWDASDPTVGPIDEQRVSKEDAIKLLSKCGMVFLHVLQSPGYHYGLVFGFKMEPASQPEPSVALEGNS